MPSNNFERAWRGVGGDATLQVLGLVLLMASPLVGTVLLWRPLDIFDHSGDFHPVLGSPGTWLPIAVIIGSALFWYRKAGPPHVRSGSRWDTFVLLFGGSLAWWAGGLMFAVYKGLGNLGPVPSLHSGVGAAIVLSIPCGLVSASCASSAVQRLDEDVRFRREVWAVAVGITLLVLGQDSLRRTFGAYDRSVAIDTIRTGGTSEHFFYLMMDPGREQAVPELRDLAEQPSLADSATAALAAVSAGHSVLREMALDTSLPPRTRAAAVKAVFSFRVSESDFAALDRDPAALAEDEAWISRLIADDDVEVRNEALEITVWEAFIAPGRRTLIDRLRVAAQDPHPTTSAEATLLLAKLGDAPSYGTVLGWFRSGAADASVCAFVLRDRFAFPVADTRYDDLLELMGSYSKCASQADEVRRRTARRGEQRRGH